VKITVVMNEEAIKKAREEKVSPLLFLLKAVVSCVEKHAETPIQAATLVMERNVITRIVLKVAEEEKEQAESTLPFCPIVKTLTSVEVTVG